MTEKSTAKSQKEINADFLSTEVLPFVIVRQPTGMNMWTHSLTRTRHVTVLFLIQYLYCVASSFSNLFSTHCHLFPYCVTLNLNIHIPVDTLHYPTDTKRSANVVDGGPTLSQHWLNVLCLQVRMMDEHARRHETMNQ